jgi:hypothetical protein
METKTSNQEWVNITQLPHHTRREVIMGKIFDMLHNRTRGFTIQRNLMSPTWGYMTGTNWMVRKWDENTTRAEIQAYVEEYLNMDENSAICIGGWISPKGEKFIQYSTRFYALENAMLVAKQYGQDAIWDIIEKKEIFIKY